jgi:hypothetical protein
VKELESENFALNELVEQLKQSLREHKKEKVHILQQHLADMERLDSLSKSKDEVMEQNANLEKHLAEKDRYLNELLSLSEDQQ